MSNYVSPYEAYPFLSESGLSILCDFELKTDKLASIAGVLISLVDESDLKNEIISVCELIYHLNPALRTGLKIADEEIAYFKNRVAALSKEFENVGFVLPMGTTAASVAHVLRAEAKEIVRLLHIGEQTEQSVDSKLFDIVNLLSAYFFFIALKLNKDAGIPEKAFVSRNY